VASYRFVSGVVFPVVTLKKDLSRYLAIEAREDDSLVGRAFVLFFALGFQSVVVYRFGHWLTKIGRQKRLFLFPVLPFLELSYRLLEFFLRKMSGIRIDRRAEIGEGFYVGHFGGIRVGGCRIGRNCSIHQLVEIEDAVVIGDEVWIGAHAKIRRGARLGAGATVMVGAMVRGDVPPGCLVSGRPARVIRKDYDNRGLLRV